MINTITLKINGKEFNKDWTDMRVIRSIDRLCSSFEFNCTQPRPFDYNEWPIKMGAQCEVLIAGKQSIVGYIEDINIDYTKDNHTVSISGRDKTADLADCSRASVDKDGKTLDVVIGRDIKVSSIIKKICAPFGIEVVIDPSAAELGNLPFPSLTVFTPGSPIIEWIMKGCKHAQIIPMATTDGKLLLTSVGNKRATTAITAGVNVTHGGLKQSNKEIFSVYTTKGFTPGIDAKLVKDFQYTQIYPMTAKDREASLQLAGRYRPLAGLSEIPGDCNTGHNRTYWEAHYRAANSRQYGYSLQGLTQDDGSLWEPNMLVTLTDRAFGIDPPRADMLINQVEVSLSSQGSVTSLQLCSKAKYEAKTSLDSILTMFDSVYAERK